MATITLIGAGAIGSHLIPHLARSEYASQVTIVDRDCYEPKNLAGQLIDARHIGRTKASVQAAVLRRINPHLVVTAIRAAVEDLPLGSLRASVILAALDSRQARMVVNQGAWRLGIPWIDAGISADELLARVRVLVPDVEAPCLECGWDQQDYDLVEQRYPCAPDDSPSATAAPSGLAALAAAVQAIECDKLLSGDVDTSLAGREVVLAARPHAHFVTAYRRDPGCRMPDHEPWAIEPLGGSADLTTLVDALARGEALGKPAAPCALGVAGQRFASALRCRGCGDGRDVVQLERHVRATKPCCERCGDCLEPLGFGLRDTLAVGDLADAVRHLPLSALGIRTGDVLRVQAGEQAACFEVGGPR